MNALDFLYLGSRSGWKGVLNSLYHYTDWLVTPWGSVNDTLYSLSPSLFAYTLLTLSAVWEAASHSIPRLVDRKNKVENLVLVSRLQHPALPAGSSNLGHMISWDQRKGYSQFFCAVLFFCPLTRGSRTSNVNKNKPLSSYCKYFVSSVWTSMSHLRKSHPRRR